MVNISPKGQISRSNFFYTKLRAKEGVPGPDPYAKFHHCHSLKCDLTAPKIAEIGNFWYKFAHKGYTPYFYKIWLEGESPRLAPSRQTLPFWPSKCGLTAKKIAKNANLWYTFAPKGYIPLDDFYKILPGTGRPRTALSCEISTLYFKTVAVRH